MIDTHIQDIDPVYLETDRFLFRATRTIKSLEKQHKPTCLYLYYISLNKFTLYSDVHSIHRLYNNGHTVLLYYRYCCKTDTGLISLAISMIPVQYFAHVETEKKFIDRN